MRKVGIICSCAVIALSGCSRQASPSLTLIGEWRSEDVAHSNGTYHYMFDLQRSGEFHLYASRGVDGGTFDHRGRFTHGGEQLILEFSSVPDTNVCKIVKLTDDMLTLSWAAPCNWNSGQVTFKRE